MAIHPTAIVDPRAEIAPDVEIGPYAVVGAVRIGAGSRLAAHAIVMGPLAMGERNHVHSFAVLGGDPQVRKLERSESSDRNDTTRVEIGDDNVFREHVTVHRGAGATITRIGSNNLFMAQAHVAHDVTVGSNVVVANAVQLAGHTVIEDYATFGGLSGVAQFVRVGESAFVAAGAMVERDVPPFCIVQGDRARVRAVNRVGLARRGVTSASAAEIERVFRAIVFSKETRARAAASVTTSDPLAARLLAALGGSGR